MFILLISLAAGIFAFTGAFFLFGVIASILPFLVVFAVTFFLLARSVAKLMEQAMMSAQLELQKGRIDSGIAQLDAIKRRFGRWQFFTKSAIDGQIGSIYFMKQDFPRSKPFLERAFSRHWIARAMLAVLYYRKKDYVEMNKIFETATKYSPKQGLLWSVWAYCLWNAGKTKEAIDVLLQGKKNLGEGDAMLSENLLNLQNGKKMKMRGYGEMWYQFHIEVPPAMHQMKQGRVRFANR